jgi:excisionase family DNA binding protein
MEKELSKKRLLSVEETAAYLGISPRTVYNQICLKAKKKFPVRPKRIGRIIRFDLQDLDRYIETL